MSVAANKLLALVNRDNATNIVEDQVVLAAPLVNPDVGVARNTKLDFSAVPGKGFRGHVTVWYNRIDLGTLFKSIDANVGLTVTEGMTTDDLIPLINAKYGTDFESVDFVQQPLVVSDAVQTVVMAAVATNVAYIGEFTIQYGIDEVALDSVVVVTTLSGFNYPNADLTKGQGAIYSFNLDGSSQPDNFWGSVAVGAVDATFVVPFNQAYRVDEDWVFDYTQALPYNLAGATVVYNGLVAEAPAGHLVNTAYNKVVIMQLAADMCTNFGGDLTVYHGGKVIPEVPAAPTNIGL